MEKLENNERTVQNPLEFYQNEIHSRNEELSRVKRKLLQSSILRITIFISGCVAAYFVFGNTTELLGIIALVLILFIVLITRHNKLKYEHDLIKELIRHNEIELEVLNRNFHHLPNGERYENPLHEFSQDIDLFGRGSFFQYINRTSTESGSDRLAFLLTENAIHSIPEKQKAIRELAQLPKWRQNFAGIASLAKTETSTEEVIEWLNNYESFVPKWIKALIIIFSIGSISLLVMNYFEILSFYFTVGWFFIGWIIHGRFQGRIGELSEKASKVQSTFQQYYQLLIQIENQEFNSDLLKEKRDSVMGFQLKSSTVVKKFARRLDALEQGSIMIFGGLMNGFFLRDLWQTFYIEEWITTHKKSVPQWFDAITFFDAYNSLGNFHFNHPHYIFPEIVENEIILDLKKAGHPLLKEETMIKNDFKIDGQQFFIITGANMAGKSTFLRTVSLQIVMSNLGLPVCAESAKYHPIKLITSMRTTDSLTDDESYFFSELKRLKFIVEQIKNDRYFIILDEILKGTNSTDKAIGSRKFVEKLVNSQSTGIIATHDLSLCEVANEQPAVKNYFFDAQIENDELYFDYTLKPGICKNMNASFLLKKMNIVD